MKIAQVAPLWESVPPKLYGGTERVVHGLTEELVKMGHDVTLYASGDSVTSAKLVPLSKEALRLDHKVIDPYVFNTLELGRIADDAQEFDIIHNHNDYFIYPITRCLDTPILTTLHGRLDLPELQDIYREFRELPLVSISNSQRRPLANLDLNWRATVYHGIALENFTPRSQPGDYLAFLGRISPEKGPDLAIDLAKRVGMKLKIAAKVDQKDFEYYKKEIKPRIDHGLIEFIGEIDEGEKDAFLGNAYALVFTICWPEPFGLTMVESMACGTPVLATNWGSVPEIMKDGVSGFVSPSDSLEDLVAAFQRIPAIDRLGCRRYAEQRFSWKRAAREYALVYERLIEETRSKKGAVTVLPALREPGRWEPTGRITMEQILSEDKMPEGEVKSA
ncbi:MAG: glycosyltransferase family 4 protein [Chloroflexi bacterium]|nr:glycosyltransferase family 4 protein [Chloroflexota bacterium]